MIAPSWLARLLPIPKTGKISIHDPITGEEAVIISKRLLIEKLTNAYEEGTENQYNGYATKAVRDQYVKTICEELNL